MLEEYEQVNDGFDGCFFREFFESFIKRIVGYGGFFIGIRVRHERLRDFLNVLDLPKLVVGGVAYYRAVREVFLIAVRVEDIAEDGRFVSASAGDPISLVMELFLQFEILPHLKGGLGRP